MKSFQIGAAMVALVGMNALATEADARNWYAKASVGVSEADVSAFGGTVSFDEGLAYGGAMGTSVGPVRVEAGVSHLSGDFAGVINADALDYHLTGYLDLPVGDNASVFGGAGIDYIDGEASLGFGSIDASGEGYHYAAGFAYRFSDRIIGEFQWRHVTADLDTSFGSVDLEANEATVGIRLAL